VAASATAIIVFAHGSRIEAANAAVRDAAAQLAQAGGYPIVQAAFLELGQPDLPSAVRSLAAQGCRRFVVVPYFLTPGLHLDRDLPRLILDISNEYNDLSRIRWMAIRGWSPHSGIVPTKPSRKWHSRKLDNIALNHPYLSRV
jgi:sirohydrochlorin cobaltochelatase